MIAGKDEIWEDEAKGTYKVQFIVKNIGSMTALKGHDVTLYIDGFEVDQKEIPVDLPPGGTYSDTFDSVITLSDNQDEVKVCADNFDEIDEINEANNCLVNYFPAPPGKPDLVVLAKGEEELGEGKFKVCFAIKNMGTAEAPAGHDAALIVNGQEVEEKEIPMALAPGDLYVGCFEAEIQAEEGLEITVCADKNDEVEELDEENNCLANFPAPPCLPEVKIDKKVRDPEAQEWADELEAEMGDELLFRIEIQNTGTCCDLENLKVVDILSESLEYANEAKVNGQPKEPDEIGPGMLPDQVNFEESLKSRGCGKPPMGLGSLFQSFKPSASSLVAVSLALRAGSEFPEAGYTATVRIREGSPQGEVLGTSTAFIPGPQLPGGVIEVLFPFDPPLSLTPGETYLIEWATPEEGDAVLTWMVAEGDPYPQGTAFDCSGTAIPDEDFLFATLRSGGTMLIWNIPGPLAPGESAIVEFKAKVVGCGEDVNIARVEAEGCGKHLSDADVVIIKKPGPPGCADFEDLPPGSKYEVGNTFQSSGVEISVERFQWSNGQWTDSGFAEIDDQGLAGGTGQDIHVNNVNLRFDFGVPCRGLSFLFGEYGGNLNIEINDDFRNFENLADIDGATIGGVEVSVAGGFGNDKGIVELSGVITSFAVGGQELWIDHVCCLEAVCCVPDIEIEKKVWDPEKQEWVEEIEASVGDEVEFLCEIHNCGTCCDLGEIEVEDLLPESLKFKSADPEPSEVIENEDGTTAVRWDLEDLVLKPCESKELYLVAEVAGSGEDVNVQKVRAFGCGKWVFDEDEASVIVSPPKLLNWPMFRRLPDHRALQEGSGAITSPQIKWSFPMIENANISSSPAVDDIDGDGDMDVVVGAWDHKLYALEGATGNELWEYETGGIIYSSPAIGDIDGDGKKEVVFGGDDHKVYALNGEDGSPLWSYEGGGPFVSSPVLGEVNGDGIADVVIGCKDRKVYAFDGPTGDVLWEADLGNIIVYSSPALAEADLGQGPEVVISIGTAVGPITSEYPEGRGAIWLLRGSTGEVLWYYLTDSEPGAAVHSSPAFGDLDGDGKNQWFYCNDEDPDIQADYSQDDF